MLMPVNCTIAPIDYKTVLQGFISRHDVVRGAAVVINRNTGNPVAGNYIAGAGVRAADQVPRRPADEYTVISIAQPRRARDIRANKIARNDVVARIQTADLYSQPGISRDKIPGSGARSANEIVA